MSFFTGTYYFNGGCILPWCPFQCPFISGQINWLIEICLWFSLTISGLFASLLNLFNGTLQFIRTKLTHYSTSSMTLALICFVISNLLELIYWLFQKKSAFTQFTAYSCVKFRRKLYRCFTQIVCRHTCYVTHYPIKLAPIKRNFDFLG